MPNSILYIEHPIHKQTLKYSCSDGERSSAITISSYVYFKSERGSSNLKLTCGKFITFGRIKYFLTHRSGDNCDKFACVAVFKEVNCDKESGRWFAKSKTVVGLKFIHLSRLSPPLVHATEGETLWFCNCNCKTVNQTS